MVGVFDIFFHVHPYWKLGENTSSLASIFQRGLKSPTRKLLKSGHPSHSDQPEVSSGNFRKSPFSNFPGQIMATSAEGHLKLFAARTVFLSGLGRVCVVEYSKWMCENGMIGDLFIMRFITKSSFVHFVLSPNIKVQWRMKKPPSSLNKFNIRPYDAPFFWWEMEMPFGWVQFQAKYLRGVRDPALFTSQKTNMSPEKELFQKERIVFQAPFFRTC